MLNQVAEGKSAKFVARMRVYDILSDSLQPTDFMKETLKTLLCQ